MEFQRLLACQFENFQLQTFALPHVNIGGQLTNVNYTLKQNMITNFWSLKYI